jgi:hypothetical protein
LCLLGWDRVLEAKLRNSLQVGTPGPRLAHKCSQERSDQSHISLWPTLLPIPLAECWTFYDILQCCVSDEFQFKVLGLVQSVEQTLLYQNNLHIHYVSASVSIPHQNKERISRLILTDFRKLFHFNVHETSTRISRSYWV